MRILVFYLTSLLIKTSLKSMELRSGKIINDKNYFKIAMAVKNIPLLSDFTEGILSRRIYVNSEDGICRSIFITTKSGDIPLLKQPEVIEITKYNSLIESQKAEVEIHSALEKKFIEKFQSQKEK